MDAVDSILVATDFSANSRLAVHRAALLAAEQEARLDLLHVISGSALKAAGELFRPGGESGTGLEADAAWQMSELRASLEADATAATPHHTEVKVGDVEQEILAAAAGHDLLVMGAQGVHGLKDRILGTTADRVLRRSDSPVLIVKRRPDASYQRVLVAIGFGPASTALLRATALLARPADITLLHAWSVPFEGRLQQAGMIDEDIKKYRNQARKQALYNIEALISEVGISALALRRRVLHGNAAQLILAEEADRNMDLIVIGKHGQSALQEALLGSVTRHVLTGARCDVLVI